MRKQFVWLAIYGLSLSYPNCTFANIPKVNMERKDQQTITGKVLSAQGLPVAGATITVKGTNKSTTTDAEGKFSLQANLHATLHVSHVSYQATDVVIEQKDLTITLQDIDGSLDEVVVIGYGKQAKADITGALTQLKADDIKQGMPISVDNMLQGKVSGVRIAQSSGEPGAGMDVYIRGVGSIRSGSTPLFVVDGIPLSNENVSANSPDFGLGVTEAKNPLNFLNTSDIETITVLKDASATAIYGARGSNGVVMITTKTGKGTEPTLTYDGSIGSSSVIKKLDVLSASEYREALLNEAYDHGGDTDWQDVLFRKGFNQNHNLSFARATTSGNYLGSISRMTQDGIVENSDFKRTTGRFNAEESFFDNKRLRIKMNMTASDINENGIPNGSSAGSDGQVIIHALMANPTRSVRDENGEFTNFNMNAHYNPAYLLDIYEDKTNTFRALGNIEASFRILDGLDYRINFGLDKSTSERSTTMYPNTTDRRPKGAYTQNNLNSLTTLLDQFLTYNFAVGKSNFETLAGFSYQKFSFSGTTFGMEEIAKKGEGVAPEYNPGYLGKSLNPSGYAQENELQSFFGRANYNYDNRYLLTASLRADGSTRFGDDKKYGYFPSFAAGWTLSNETFMKDIKAIRELKIRGSWGQTGNQEVDNKITKDSYSLDPAAGYYLYEDLALVNGVTVNRTANPKLKWEVVEQYNIGADFDLWNGRLYGSLEYYNKTTKDPILNIPSEPLSATNNIWKNVEAKLVNKGFEFMLGTRILSNEHFRWNLDVNGSTLSNIVKDMPVSELYSGEVSGPGLSGVTANIYKNGYEAGSFFMLKHLGYDQDGKDIFEDTNGDEVINSADRQIFEGAIPNFNFGINNQFGYKGFDLAFSIIGQTGGYLVNNTALDLNINSLASDRNVLAKFKQDGANPTNSVQLSSLYLEKSDFIRLNNVQLGYTLPTNLLKFMKSCHFYVSAQNLLTISDYSGYDPLVNTMKAAGGNQSLGIDYTTYPSAKSFLFGATLKF